jgi:hypothetical protein
MEAVSIGVGGGEVLVEVGGGLGWEVVRWGSHPTTTTVGIGSEGYERWGWGSNIVVV